MQPIFKHLDALSSNPIHLGWFDKADVKRKSEHQSKCAEIRIMHITIILFNILTATFALALTATGLFVPITSGHVASGCCKVLVGAALGFLAYDLNNLREIVQKTRDIFDEYVQLNHKKKITSEIQQKWALEAEKLKKSYANNVFAVSQILEFVWPIPTPSPS